MSQKVWASRSHYEASFAAYAAELGSGFDLIRLGVEENALLKREAKDSKLKKMEQELMKEAIRLDLSPVEFKRVAIKCGLESDLTRNFVTEFIRKIVSLHRIAG